MYFVYGGLIFEPVFRAADWDRFLDQAHQKNRPGFIFCWVLVAVISVRLAAFRREVVSGMRGPTLKQPRCILNLRDHRFESALTGGH